MSDYNLKGMQGSAIFQLQESVGRLKLEGDWKLFRDKVRSICDHFLNLSAASLFVDVKPDMFVTNLCRCAENWRRFLLSSQKHFAKQPTLTFNQPLFGAIISGDQQLITGIASELPETPVKGEEYDDNFHLSWLFILLANRGCVLDDEIEQHLQSYELATDDTSMLNMFKALLDLDELSAEDFWDSFESSLYEYDEEVLTKVNSSTTSITKFIAHRYLWFKGMALIHLALIKGFSIPYKDIKYCPDDALKRIPKAYSGDWLLVPLAS